MADLLVESTNRGNFYVLRPDNDVSHDVSTTKMRSCGRFAEPQPRQSRYLARRLMRQNADISVFLIDDIIRVDWPMLLRESERGSQIMDLEQRHAFAMAACQEAGTLALSYFAKSASLVVDRKGQQDWVSEADTDVEAFLRSRIAQAWPSDGIFGEEHGATAGDSGFDWVIDPIDGTTNFVNGIPNWTVVLAGVCDAQTKVGVIHDPNMSETFSACRQGGARLNGVRICVASDATLANGTIAVGYSNRVMSKNVIPLIHDLMSRGAMFHRNASGTLSLAYVAAGRLLGYLKEHMNAWDCLAGQLLVEEAGGVVEPQDANDMIAYGGRVVVGTPDVFETLKKICDDAWGA